jgi:hypothetical protein
VSRCASSGAPLTAAVRALAPPRSPTGQPGWQRQGLCRHDPESWWADHDPILAAKAARVCVVCSVSGDCWAAFRAQTRDWGGTWAGFTWEHRETVRARERRTAAIVGLAAVRRSA